MELPLTKGFKALFHYQQHSEPAVVTKLNALLDKTTGEETKKHPRCLPKNSTAVIELTFDKPVCLELSSTSKVRVHVFAGLPFSLILSLLRCAA